MNLALNQDSLRACSYSLYIILKLVYSLENTLWTSGLQNIKANLKSDSKFFMFCEILYMIRISGIQVLFQYVAMEAALIQRSSHLVIPGSKFILIRISLIHEITIINSSYFIFRQLTGKLNQHNRRNLTTAIFRYFIICLLRGNS